tara:strand:+ start:114186 stop:114926 length:741 start_codon:yes stop_codon:yes gene_type:complete
MLPSNSLKLYSIIFKDNICNYGTCFAIQNPYGKKLFVTNAHVIQHTKKNSFFKFWKPTCEFIYGDELIVQNTYNQSLKAKHILCIHEKDLRDTFIDGIQLSFVQGCTDIAILEIEDCPEHFVMKELPLKSVNHSDKVIVNTEGFCPHTMRYVSHYLSDNTQGYILDANKEIIHGTSGAPVLDQDGYVLGVTHRKLSTTESPFAFYKKDDQYFYGEYIPHNPTILYGLVTPSKIIIDALIKHYGYYH